MTRYLPIRKEEFDLRSHIESSGHNVETSHHVILTEKMCKGYLVKMGGKIKSWKKRWFVFDRLKRTFSYYVGKENAAIYIHVYIQTYLCALIALIEPMGDTVHSIFIPFDLNVDCICERWCK